jgi:hypothetical protein
MTQPDVAAVVPADWDGEPSKIGVTQDSWLAITNPELSGTVVDLAHEVKELILGGDIVYLLDHESKPTHRITVQQDRLALIALQAR